MQDNTQTGSIDVDALVDALLKNPTKEAAPEAPPKTETPSSAQGGLAAKEQPASLLTDGDEPMKGPQKHRRIASLFRRLGKKQPDLPDDTPDETWADWDLKPIGHYHVDEHTHLLTATRSNPVAERESDVLPPVKPAAEPVVEDMDEPTPCAPPSPAEEATPDDTTPAPVQDIPAPAPVVEQDEFPAVQAVEETVALPVIHGQPDPVAEDATRVIKLPSPVSADPQPPVAETPEDDRLPNQLTLEECLRVEDIDETAPVSDEDPAALLQQAREERIRDFTLGGEEEEPNEPEEEPVPLPEEGPEIEDFTTYADTEAVQLELQYRSRTALLTLVFTGVLELVLLLLTALTLAIGQSPITEIGYLTVQVFGLALMLVLNFQAVSRGLSGLFTLHANGDTGAAIAVCVALCGIIMHFMDISRTLPVWAPVAGLLMVMNAAGYLVRAERIRRNFAFVSYPGEKFTARLIEDEKALHEIGRRAVIDGEAEVAYFRRANFLDSYLANSHEDDRADSWMCWMAPISIGLALVVSLVCLLSGALHGFWDWLQAFVGMLCVALPAASLAVQLAMSQCSRVMLSRGGFMVGWKAVQQFGNPDALAVDVADLFPNESMLLHGIKTFGGAHIDEAILDAASLAVRSEGPLSLIFRRIIENKESLLRPVDNLVYEQAMGLSGWVNDRRVLVGNRNLLQHHGVDVPSSDYEARYAKDGRRLVYLAVAGELCAMFVVSYLPDPAIKEALGDLQRAKVTLLVRSCDPNITAKDLCRDFELDDYYVDMLPSAAGRLYVQLTEGQAESVPAVLASNGHILGTAMAMAACRSLRSKALMALVVQVVLAALGLLLCTLWLGKGIQVYFMMVLLYTAVTAFLSWLIPLFRRL